MFSKDIEEGLKKRFPAKLQEVKEDLEKRIMFIEKSCISCADPLKVELSTILYLEDENKQLKQELKEIKERYYGYIQHLEHENRVYKTDIHHAANVLHDHCKNTDLCENCIFAVSNDKVGFVYCELTDGQPEDWNI